MAFAWNGEHQENYDIYVIRTSMNAPVRITSSVADDISPVWSPDGRQLAFVRRLNYERGELIVVASAGGPEHKIADLHDQELEQSPGRLLSLTWSPDGRSIGASHRAPEDRSERIYLFSLTGDKRPLTYPQSAYGDHTPTLSRDGRLLAFSRLSGHGASEVSLMRLDSQLHPVEEARLITSHKQWSVRPVWTGEGRFLVYLKSQQPGGKQELRVMTPAGEESALPMVEMKDDPAELALNSHLVYSTNRYDTNLWRIALSQGRKAATPERFVSSTWPDGLPRYSPDGSKIAYVSSRSGTPEIWVADADGQTSVRLTSFDGAVVGQPSWSPDGRHIVFHARPDGQSDLFLLPVAGGQPKQLTIHAADDAAPTFSADGKWIYFGSARSGKEEIWRMPVSGGNALQLTRTGGGKPAESPDGNFVFYIGKDGSGIRRVPVTGGATEPVVGPLPFYIYAYAVTNEGIFYPIPESSTSKGEQRRDPLFQLRHTRQQSRRLGAESERNDCFSGHPLSCPRSG